MGVPPDSGIEAAVNGVQAHFIAEKAQIQADNFNPQYHVHSFRYGQGVLLVEFLPQGTTINSTAYCEIMKKLRLAPSDFHLFLRLK
jgi:hypothetical protein